MIEDNRQQLKDFNEIRKKLKQLSSKKLAEKLKKVLSGRVKVYGIKPPALKKIAAQYSKRYLREDDPNGAYMLAEMLVKARSYEEPTVGIELMARFSKYFNMNVFWGLEKWIDYMNTSYNTDLLSERILGVILKKYDHDMKYLYYWADSTNKWRRRAAAVFMIEPLKDKKDIEEGFEMAKRLCGDKVDEALDGFKKLMHVLKKINSARAIRLLKDHAYQIPDRILDVFIKNSNYSKIRKVKTSKKPKKRSKRRFGSWGRRKPKKKAKKKPVKKSKKSKKKKRR